MRIIVGSTALKQHGYVIREPDDLDIFTDEERYFPPHPKGTELHHVPSIILDIIPVMVQDNIHYATPDAIYTLKCSHLGWDIKWQKHAQDVMWLARKGCKIIPELYWAFYKYWQTVHKDKSFLNLNKTKEEFFNDYVNYSVDHDELHRIVAGKNLPTYTKVLQHNKEVLISYEKFMQMSFEDQVKLFREEVQVIALERFLIPNNLKRGKYEAYLMSLKRTITNLTKNWATLFIVDNLEIFYRMDSTVWYSNYIKSNGDIMTQVNYEQMNDVSEEVQAKIVELEDNFGEYEAISILTGNEGYSDEDKEFLKWLQDTYDFEYIDGNDSGEGQGEYCFAIFKLRGQLYKAEYAYYSYDGHNYDTFWDWTPVKAVKKEITDYE